jgi:hypothetical protein
MNSLFKKLFFIKLTNAHTIHLFIHEFMYAIK